MTPPASGPTGTSPGPALAVMADHLERYHEEVGAMLPPYVAADRGDVISALVEAERALRTAARLVRRAGRLT
ncbi:MAG: hypothetical protein RLZ04_639 [Actinomycetota bacterium]|jgi:hypothetical protein